MRRPAGALAFVAALASGGAHAGAGAEFLRLVTAARPAGMAEAYAAIAQGAGALALNPAGLAQGRDVTAGFAHAAEHGGQRQETVSVSASSGRFGAGARLAYATVEGRVADALGNLRSTDASDAVASLAGAARLGERVFGGVTIKTYSSSLLDRRAQGVAADAGLLVRLRPDLKAGAVLADVGPAVDYGGGGERLPARLRTGLAYALSLGPRGAQVLIASAEWNHEFVNGERSGTNLGAEFGMARGVSLRGGFTTVRERARGTFGASINWGPAAVHYSLAPRGGVGMAHRFSLEYRWRRRDG